MANAKRTRPEADGGTKRCAIYIRVSTDKQVERDSLSAQESQMLSYAEMRHWSVVKVFTDPGFSAKNTRRPALQQMLKAAEDDQIDVILVSKIDRISRNLSDLLGLIDKLKLWNVEFVSASQSFDTSTPMGSLTLNILGSFAQFEREVTAERVRENMRERAKGGIWSGGKPPFGYRINLKTKKLEVVRKEAEVVRDMFDDFLEHRSVRHVVHTMNAARTWNRDGKQWGLSTVRRLLTSPVYIGTVSYAKRGMRSGRLRRNRRDHWIVTENVHEAIIDREDFDAAQAGLARNRGPKTWPDASPHLLCGLVRCGKCGGGMTGITNRNKARGSVNRYYRCSGHIQKGSTFCTGVSYRADELEQAVVSQLVGFDADTLRRELKDCQKRLVSQVRPLAKRLGRLKAEFEKFRERERRLLELYEAGAIEIGVFKQRRGELENERLAVAKEITELESQVSGDQAVEVDPDAVVKRFKELRETFPNLDAREQQLLLRAMVNRVVAQDGGRVEIDFNLISGLDGKRTLNTCREVEVPEAGVAAT